MNFIQFNENLGFQMKKVKQEILYEVANLKKNC